MKKITLSLIALSLVAFGLTGCNDFNSPKGVVETAYSSLMLNDTKLFTETLRGEAFERYGNLEGMIDLQRNLKDFDVEIGKVKEVDSVGRGFRGRTDTYSVEIVGKKADSENVVLYVAAVKCEIIVTHHWVVGPRGSGYRGGFPDTGFPSSEKVSVQKVDCRIFDITK